MRVAKIIGKVVLSRSHSSFDGANLKLAVPLSLGNIDGSSNEEADSVVVWDELGAGDGAIIGMAEGPEAAQPFRPDLKPVDAYVAAILDSINLHAQTVAELKNGLNNNHH